MLENLQSVKAGKKKFGNPDNRLHVYCYEHSDMGAVRSTMFACMQQTASLETKLEL